MEAVQHYNRGGEVKQDLSPNIKALKLNQQEMEAHRCLHEGTDHPPETLQTAAPTA